VKIAVVTIGSRGDFQPYLALARALQRAGHEVRLGGPNLPEFAHAAAEHDLSFTPIGPPTSRDHIRSSIDTALRMRSQASQSRFMVEKDLEPHVDQLYDDCYELVRWSDVQVAHHVQIVARLAAEKLDHPHVTGMLATTGLRSRHRPPPGLPDFGPRSNDLLWTLVFKRYQQVLGPVINRLRQHIGLRPYRDVLDQGFVAASRNLLAISPRVIPAAPDWPTYHRFTGYWFLDRPDWTPPPGLAAFLEREPKPIAVTFGSMTTHDDARLGRLVIEAISQSGLRAVVPAGWLELDNSALPANVHLIGDVAYEWLFPRVAAVIHHGGAGTTAAAFRAGVPMGFVPHLADNSFWAGTARNLGVAPAPLSLRRLSVAKLAHLMRRLVEDATLHERALQLAAAIQPEDGLGVAVRLIEEFARSPNRAGPVDRSA
jgi:sterol 3beta-glucosyltransferase